VRQSAVARRYVGALFEMSAQTGVVDKVESDLGLITYSLENIPRLAEVLEHPLIPPERKKAIVTDIFGNKIEQVTLNFLYLIIDKRRESILPDVEPEFVRLANDLRGIEPIMVTAAVSLTPEERTALKVKLEKLTSKKVELHITEDPSLIGGLVLRIGDTVIDGSVQGYLESLKNKLLGKE